MADSGGWTRHWAAKEGAWFWFHDATGASEWADPDDITRPPSALSVLPPIADTSTSHNNSVKKSKKKRTGFAKFLQSSEAESLLPPTQPNETLSEPLHEVSTFARKSYSFMTLSHIIFLEAPIGSIECILRAILCILFSIVVLVVGLYHNLLCRKGQITSYYISPLHKWLFFTLCRECFDSLSLAIALAVPCLLYIQAYHQFRNIDPTDDNSHWRIEALRIGPNGSWWRGDVRRSLIISVLGVGSAAANASAQFPPQDVALNTLLSLKALRKMERRKRSSIPTPIVDVETNSTNSTASIEEVEVSVTPSLDELIVSISQLICASDSLSFSELRWPPRDIMTELAAAVKNRLPTYFGLRVSLRILRSHS